MGVLNCDAQNDGDGQDEGHYRQHHIVGDQQPERMIADCEPEPRVSLILVQQSFGVTVHCVEGSQVSICRCPVRSWTALTLVWVV